MADGTLVPVVAPIYAYSYLRLSTKDQIKGDGERRQLEAAKQYAEQNGLVLDDSLRDLGVSGWTGKNLRPGADLHKFLEMVKQGRVPSGSYLLVEDFDRISRLEPMEARDIIKTLAWAGIVIVTLRDNQRYDRKRFKTDIGAGIRLEVTLALANMESEKKSERVGATWRQKKEHAASGPITTAGPNWLRGVKTGERRNWKRHWEPIPERVREAKEILRMLAEGMGAFSAARATGWSRASINRLLWNDWALGFYQPTSVTLPDGTRAPDGKRVNAGDPVPNYYPVIVDEDLLGRARAAVGSRRNKGARGRKGKHYSNLFRPVCRCGGTMRYKVKGTGGKLMCSRQLETKEGCPHAVMNSRGATWIDYDRFEAAVLDNVTEMWDAFVMDARADARTRSAQEDVSRLRSELIGHEKKVALWTGKLEAMDDAPDSMWEKVASMGRELTERRAGVAQAEKELALLGTDDVTRVEAIKRVRAEMAKLEGPDLYRARARLAAEIDRVVDRVTFAGDRVVITLKTGRHFGYVVVGGKATKVARRPVRIQVVARPRIRK